MQRIDHYFWETKLSFYKQTRNGLIGLDYSSKLSPWLSVGAHSLEKFSGLLKNTKRIREKSIYLLANI